MSADPAAAPSGVVTFLFTDVEGSTRRWEADADGMRAALAAHDEMLRNAIEAHGGWLFKHTGDGVCAAFASPRCAVDAAVAAQRALELPVRMGLATGEAELRDARQRCVVPRWRTDRPVRSQSAVDLAVSLANRHSQSRDHSVCLAANTA